MQFVEIWNVAQIIPDACVVEICVLFFKAFLTPFTSFAPDTLAVYAFLSVSAMRFYNDQDWFPDDPDLPPVTVKLSDLESLTRCGVGLALDDIERKGGARIVRRDDETLTFYPVAAKETIARHSHLMSLLIRRYKIGGRGE